MSMPGVDAPTLHEIVAVKKEPPRSFYDRGTALRFTDLARGTSFDGRPRELAGRSVLLATESQLTGTLALIELEGVARRIVILPPDADPAHLPAIIATAGIDAVFTDEGAPTHAAFDRITRLVCRPVIEPVADDLPPRMSHRLGDDDLWHHRRAEDGRPRSCNAHRRAAGTEPGRRRRCLGHVLQALLLPSGSDGVYARTALYEDMIERLAALVTRHREPGTEVMRFPPVMNRAAPQEIRLPQKFSKDLLGCVCGLQRNGT